MNEPFQELLAGLRAAAEATRLRVLALCAEGELSVGEIARILDQSQPRISRHLKLLCEAGLVDRFPEGASAFYRAAQRGPGAALVAALIARLPDADRTLAADRDALAAVRDARFAEASARFRRYAPRWNKVRALYVAEDEVERLLAGLIPETGLGDLLDIGTGTGRMLELFAPRAARAVGIDSARDMVALARANLARAGLANCTVRQADMFRLPWPAGSFDLALMHQVLHFAETPAAAIAQAARVLRPGGELVVVDFAPHGLRELFEADDHRRLGFEDDEMLDWFRAGALEPQPVRRLPGDPLTVTVWRGRRPAAVDTEPVSQPRQGAA